MQLWELEALCFDKKDCCATVGIWETKKVVINCGIQGQCVKGSVLQL